MRDNDLFEEDGLDPENSMPTLHQDTEQADPTGTHAASLVVNQSLSKDAFLRSGAEAVPVQSDTDTVAPGHSCVLFGEYISILRLGY